MKTWERALVTPDMTLREAMGCIDRAGSQMALVVDDRRRLLGTLSDGDARRGLLGGLSLADKVSAAMHLNPTVANARESRHAILTTMRQRGLHQIPVVDDDGIVVGMELVDDFLTTRVRENWVVIMAGGLGSRLAQLTRDTPKPMLRVGSRPLLETIVMGYAAQGFRRFYFAVNYKAEQIEQHFGDGRGFGVEIRYLHEEQRLRPAEPAARAAQRSLRGDQRGPADQRGLRRYGRRTSGIGRRRHDGRSRLRDAGPLRRGPRT
jgi:hypothetical protein